jgi:hypothetical protein
MVFSGIDKALKISQLKAQITKHNSNARDFIQFELNLDQFISNALGHDVLEIQKTVATCLT